MSKEKYLTCQRCGFNKKQTRFFYNNHNKKYDNICKQCRIKQAASGRERQKIRDSKDIKKIKDEVDNDEKYMQNGIEFLAEIITKNLMEAR